MYHKDEERKPFSMAMAAHKSPIQSMSSNWSAMDVLCIVIYHITYANCEWTYASIWPWQCRCSSLWRSWHGSWLSLVWYKGGEPLLQSRRNRPAWSSAAVQQRSHKDPVGFWGLGLRGWKPRRDPGGQSSSSQASHQCQTCGVSCMVLYMQVSRRRKGEEIDNICAIADSLL